MRRTIIVALMGVVIAACAAGGSHQQSATPSPMPRQTGIGEVDYFLDLIRSRNAKGLHDLVGFEQQMCQHNPQPSPTGPLTCDAQPYDAGTTVDMTRSAVFVFAGPGCGSISFLTRPLDVNTAIDEFVARHTALSIYGVGLGGLGKWDEGYRVVVTDGREAAPEAEASVWVLKSGRILRVDDGCPQTAAGVYANTGALNRPLLEPERHP